MSRSTIVSIKKVSKGKYVVTWKYSSKGRRRQVTTNYLYCYTGTSRFQKRGRGADLPPFLYKKMEDLILNGEYISVKTKKKSGKLKDSRVVQSGASGSQVRQERIGGCD